MWKKITKAIHFFIIFNLGNIKKRNCKVKDWNYKYIRYIRKYICKRNCHGILEILLENERNIKVEKSRTPPILNMWLSEIFPKFQQV